MNNLSFPFVLKNIKLSSGTDMFRVILNMKKILSVLLGQNSISAVI